jgi:25S rRNA (cytosine2870-C5)-methyltransferase
VASHAFHASNIPIQAFDFGSDEEEDEPVTLGKTKKSKQLEKPTKIIPFRTGSYSSEDETDSEEADDDEPTTMANIEYQSKALDAAAAAEAQLDLEEMQELDGEDEEEDVEEGMDVDVFHLPTVEEIEEEKKAGGPDVQAVQRRIREIARVLGKFRKLAEEGR